MGQLWYIGHVGTGKLKQQDWKNLTTVVRGLSISERPFVNNPNRSKEANWVKPEITVKINFMEWTRYTSLRQPSVQSIVNVHVKECTFNQT
jgi:bifunctional non-homologous end joining protein LigD